MICNGISCGSPRRHQLMRFGMPTGLSRTNPGQGEDISVTGGGRWGIEFQLREPKWQGALTGPAPPQPHPTQGHNAACTPGAGRRCSSPASPGLSLTHRSMLQTPGTSDTLLLGTNWFWGKRLGDAGNRSLLTSPPACQELARSL